MTFPLIRPSVIGGGLLALALSLEEFIVTLFTTGGDSTVPVVIWGQMRRGVSPTVNAISSLLLAATVLLVLITRRLTGATGGGGGGPNEADQRGGAEWSLVGMTGPGLPGAR